MCGRTSKVRRNMKSAMALVVFALALAWPCGPALAALSACSLLTPADVSHLTGWDVNATHRRRYSIHGASGAMCSLESTQGIVLVMVPDIGSPYPGDAALAASGANEFASHGHEFGTEVTTVHGTAYFTVGERDIAVRLVPTDHDPSNAEVEPFARAILERLRTKAHKPA